MPTALRFLSAALCAALLLALGGCAVPRRIDSDVQSFTTGQAQRPASYRFERLPSQSDVPEQQALEAMATTALAKVGLTPAPLVSGAIAGTAAAAPSARYAVQVSARVEAITSPYGNTFAGTFWSRRHWFGASMEPPWYRHAVHIVLRDSVGGTPVYETGATFDGPWNDSGNLLPVLLDAALQGYPQPPGGPRKVVIELSGDAPAAP